MPAGAGRQRLGHGLPLWRSVHNRLHAQPQQVTQGMLALQGDPQLTIGDVLSAFQQAAAQCQKPSAVLEVGELRD